MQVFLGIMMVYGYLRMVGSEGCVLASDYICKVLPQSFPPGLSSIVLLVSNLREINSSIFSSETLQSVNSLTIANAGIVTISTGAFNSFCQLKKLSLYQNSISQISASWFCQPAKLENLTLFQNNVEMLNEQSLAGLSGLTSLNLANNKIYAIALRSFYTQKRLAHLDLSGNKLTFLSPDTFLVHHSIQMRLERNPWDCSCEVKGFVRFLKGMINDSMLENEMEVTCDTPALLRGQHVWNVSECILHTRSRSDMEALKKIIPTVVGFLGALCILLYVACLQNKKSKKARKVEPDLEISRKNSIFQDEGTQKECKIWHSPSDEQGAWPKRESRVRCRTQSAGARLSTYSFADKIFKTESEGFLGKRKLPEETGLNICLSEMDNTEQQNKKREIVSMMSIQVAENLPYLSIGTNAADRNPIHQEDHHWDNNDGSLARKIRRISTWPKTLYQWREQSKNEHKIFSPYTADSTNVCDLCKCRDSTEQQNLSSEWPPRDGIEQKFPTADEGFIDEEANTSATKNTTSEGHKGLLFFQEEPAASSYAHSDEVSTRKCHLQDQTSNQPEQHDDPGCASLNLGWQWDMEREKEGSHGMAQKEGCGCGSGTSPALHLMSSFQDQQENNPQQNNEYNFIDLLHEVVQNQGRWTRDRWKQTHLNKNRNNKLSHTH